jgi:hypothetical protein
MQAAFGCAATDLEDTPKSKGNGDEWPGARLIDAHEAHRSYLQSEYDIVRHECGGSLQHDGRTASENVTKISTKQMAAAQGAARKGRQRKK